MKRQTVTISLPSAMAEQVEEAMKVEQRTRSELVREALRTYFSTRFPVVEASKAELAAIRRGRAAFKRGEYVSVEELFHDLERSSNKSSRKESAANPRKRRSAH